MEVIKVENISKAYQLGQFSTGTLSQDLKRWWALTQGKEDPFLRIGETNDRTISGETGIVWSLKDINFSVEAGDTIGVIGRNGAGKSTLLKILSQITAPTEGKIKIKGRVASLLEVGTGFHPELTGRENIFLNGAILGMRKDEIKRKFDEIVEFAAVERYIDTPVKRYSSGMYVRLAFAVAAHLESEILIVDEVLAVGDAEFQKKCLGKMGTVSKSEGRTILFVSHNLGMVRSLCTKGIVLNHGVNEFVGTAFEAIRYYNSKLAQQDMSGSEKEFTVDSSLDYYFTSCRIVNAQNQLQGKFDVFEPAYLSINYTLIKPIKSMNICWGLTKQGEELAYCFDTDFNEELLGIREPGKYSVRCKLPSPMKSGDYSISTLSMGIANVEAFHVKENVLKFSVEELTFDPTFKSFSANRAGMLVVDNIWETVSYESL